MMGKAPTITGSFARYEYDGAIFRRPSQCGLPNKIFSRLVIPAEVLAGKSEVWQERIYSRREWRYTECLKG
jgi:hypothetical protein